MKNYKKALLATMVIAAMPLLAATSSNVPIKVTTFEDEDGGNLNACSLREALKTAETRKSYGGCLVTDTSSSTQKVIQLEAGTYLLKSELTPNVNVAIWGESPVDWQEKNVLINDIVNQYPAEIPLKTTIQAENSRIFNTTIGTKILALSNVILKGGRTTDRGGAIYAGADVILQSTQILDSQADKEGGAIFLAGPSAKLTLSQSLLQGNRSPKGSVLSMSCFNDTVYSKREVNINSNSLVSNGDGNSSSLLEFCGEPAITLNTNTIAQNAVNASTGNLIKFTGDTKVGRDSNNISSILSNSSTLTLSNNTIVENQGFTTLLYDKLGTKKLNFNIIAYNGGSNTYACRYLLGNATDQKDVKLSILSNALSLTGNNKCDVPSDSLKDNKTNFDISEIADIRQLLSPLQQPSAYTSYFPLYYPKTNKITVGQGDDKKEISLVNTGAINCETVDQRGLARSTTLVLFYDPETTNTCDIGSVELMKLTAGDISSSSNTSISEMIAGYQKQYDFFDNLVKNPNNPDFLTYYKSRLVQYKNLLDGFNDVERRKKNLKYRAVYVDLSNYKLPLPQEVEQADGSHKIQFFNTNDYNINIETLGVGQLENTVLNIQQPPDPNLVCEWSNDLQQIIIYRKDDVITQAGDNAFCKYTIQSKTDSNVKSSGLIRASFANIKPLVTDTSITFKYQQKQKLSLNLLTFANDDGDSGTGGTGPELKPNKAKFWKNEEGIELPIRLTNVPTRDLNITADRQGACPAPDEKETCYGGNIYVQEVNAFNPFNFSFNYQVYDADGVSSNSATVRTISTATTTDDTRPASSGGGSFGFYSVFGLFGLLAYRRFKK
ncbi:hypothetical protein F993_02155 [Acinetobacter proteolyticus]|uniref:CSLREA domain-containing protein n=1 Tax=Acinetobacter proteolyticus TaxID=1776741 RepID=A0ABN0JDS3_9GAMM|nr:CSLREA domain-containing protein [Acinetobacter proteolyticus]ENU23286.1 hypothetical protein F993_02155 [Acinetobacter proteolyticus]